MVVCHRRLVVFGGALSLKFGTVRGLRFVRENKRRGNNANNSKSGCHYHKKRIHSPSLYVFRHAWK